MTENNKDRNEPVKILNISHKVEKGETLHAIAKRYGVSVQQIVESNSLKNNQVKSGQLLTINTSAQEQSKDTITNKPSNTSSKASRVHSRSKTKTASSKKKRHQSVKN